ncbi:MAG: hypothetical protein SFV23_23775 [Planctomycetaceae bacterium]|nr:hypothetical protein [Planctomycetaceae bacterium]
MLIYRTSAQVTADRRIEVQLPIEVPLGRADIVVTVADAANEPKKATRSSLSDWADEHAEHWGDRLDSTDVAGFTGRSF